MKITKLRAIAIFSALGITQAPKWNAVRMKAKINKFDEMIDGDTDIAGNPIVQEDVDAVLAAIKAGDTIEVTDDKPATKKPATKKAASGKPPAGKGKGKEKPAKTNKTDKPEVAAAKPDKTPDKAVGVRETKTRAYCAGVVVAKHGLAAGVTPEMVAEVNELYGKDNDVESLGRLKNVWHGVRGFQAKAE